MKGCRNILVHEYGHVLDEIVFEAVSTRLVEFEEFSRSTAPMSGRAETFPLSAKVRAVACVRVVEDVASLSGRAWAAHAARVRVNAARISSKGT